MRAKKTDIAERIADALLDGGVAQIPLRELAARLGTSDRMLLYYFGDKAELVRCSVSIVSARLAGMLGGALAPMAPAALARAALDFLLSEPVRPYMAVWGDLVARAGRGEEPFRAMGETVMAGWQNWAEDRLEGVTRSERPRIAAALLIVLEGARQMEAIRPGSARAAADILIAGFESKERSAGAAPAA